MDSREKKLVAYTTAAHSLNHAYILLLPILILVWVEEFASDLYAMGVVAAVGYAFFGAGSLPWGYLSDRFRARTLLLIYLAGAALSLLLLSMAGGILQLVVGVSLLGIFASVHHPTATSSISREVRERGRGLGYHGMGGSLGVAIGPLAASLLLLSLSWREVLLIMATPALFLAGVFALWGPVELASRRRPGIARPASIINFGFGLVLLVYIFAGIAYWGALTFLPAYLNTLPLPSIALGSKALAPAGYLFPALLAAGAVGQVAGGFLADRSRVEVTLAASSWLVALLASLLILPVSAAVAALVIAFGFLLFMLEPLQNVLVSARSEERVRGLAFGLVFLAVFGIGSVGAVMGGYLSVEGNYGALFPLLGLFMAASGGVAFWLSRHGSSQPTISSRRLE